MKSPRGALALVVTMVAGLGLAAPAGLGSAAAFADTTAVNGTLDCVAHAPVIGDQNETQGFSVSTDAPLSVVPGATFTAIATTPVTSVSSKQTGGTISGIKNIQQKVPVPANSTFVSASLSGGFNYGSGTPTITLQGSPTTGTMILSVPGPIAADQNYQLPAISMTLTASGPALSTIQPKMGGTSVNDPGLTTTASVTSPITADVPTDCWPEVPNPSWSTTTIVPPDATPPVITMNTPANGGSYPVGATVLANYTCNDGQFGSGVATCTGTVANGTPIDTSALGTHTFTVNATDNKGNIAAPVTHTYDVVLAGNDHTPPVVTLTSPANGAVYLQGAATSASYACSDDGSGLAACTGTAANGTAISTAAVGAHSFAVTGTDNEGNTETITHSYRVTPTAIQQNFTTGDLTNEMPVTCDSMIGTAAHTTVPVSANTAPTSAAKGQQLNWNLALGAAAVPTLNNGTNLIYRWKAPTNGHFVSAALTGAGTMVNGSAIAINADGTLQLTISSVTDQGTLGVGADNYTPPPFQAVIQADGAAGAAVQNTFDYFEITTTTATLPTTHHCPAGDTFNSRANVAITTTTIVDPVPPSISVSSPVDGDTYPVGSSVPFTFSCSDTTGTPTCVGSQATGTSIATAVSGPYHLNVTATDAAGNIAARSIEYTVKDPTVSLADATVTEGPGAALQFAMTLSNASARQVSVSYATIEGTATAPDDYTNAAGEIDFAPGDPLTKIVSVPVTDNNVFTGNRALSLSIVSTFHATVDRGTATGTIIDDDPPTISAGDAAVTEGPGAALDFTVTLATQPNFPVTVDYATADGTATAPNRYTATSGTLTFNPGDPLTQHVPVGVIDDGVYNEGASKIKTQAMGLVFTEVHGNVATGTGTITDDDVQPPLLNIGSATIREGDTDLRSGHLTVTLNQPVAQPVTVHYATVGGSAVAPSDFKAKSGTVVFKPGITSMTVTYSVYGDTRAEADETYTIKLSAPTNAIVDHGTGTVTILDDDSPTATSTQVSVGDATMYEGSGTKLSTMSFLVSLTSRPAANVTLVLRTFTGTAGGADFKPNQMTLTFSTKQVAKSFTVSVFADKQGEQDETMSVQIISSSGPATVSDDTGIGTIANDD